jgi:hypothetical protein
MAFRVHRLLKVIAFNAKGICRRCCKLSKQMQNLHIVGVPLLSETHLKPHYRLFSSLFMFYTMPLNGKLLIPLWVNGYYRTVHS